MKNLNDFAKEINNDWSNEYLAIVQDDELRVKYNHEVVVIMYSDFDIDLQVDGMDDVLDELLYMIER